MFISHFFNYYFFLMHYFVAHKFILFLFSYFLKQTCCCTAWLACFYQCICLIPFFFFFSCTFLGSTCNIHQIPAVPIRKKKLKKLEDIYNYCNIGIAIIWMFSIKAFILSFHYLTYFLIFSLFIAAIFMFLGILICLYVLRVFIKS